MAFPYKHVLLIGATSGIGHAMATRFIKDGFKVTVVGRRQDRLDAFVQEHGREKASSATFDIGNLQDIPQFVDEYALICGLPSWMSADLAFRVTTAHPDIDCVFLNAGFQFQHDLTKPEKLDLNGFLEEMKINYSSFVCTVNAVLPHLFSKPSAGIIL